jgi:hypothetical protein
MTQQILPLFQNQGRFTAIFDVYIFTEQANLDCGFQNVLSLIRRFLERMQENQQVRLHRECTPTSRKILMALDSLYRMTE